MKIYLAGPINGCTDAEAKDWRAYATAHLSAHEVFDPMVRDYRGRELEPGIASIIVEQDKTDIDVCDVLLVLYEKPSVGTSMEILYAHATSKKILLVDVSGKPLSPWLTYHASAIFKSLDEALQSLNQPLESLPPR